MLLCNVGLMLFALFRARGALPRMSHHVSLAYVPGVHRAQPVAAAVPLKDPTAHGVQVLAPESKTCRNLFLSKNSVLVLVLFWAKFVY